MISALNGDGLPDYLAWLAKTLPEGPFLYPEGERSDQNPRVAAAEITREKVFLRLHQELPYSTHVETEEWEEKRDGSLRIGQAIYVQRESHKKIVLGAKGQTIRQIGAAARADIGKRLGPQGAPVPVREGARELDRRPGAVSRDGVGFLVVSDVAP